MVASGGTSNEVFQADDEKILLSKEGFLMRDGMRTWKNKRLLVRKDYATIVSKNEYLFCFFRERYVR